VDTEKYQFENKLDELIFFAYLYESIELSEDKNLDQDLKDKASTHLTERKKLQKDFESIFDSFV